MSNPLETAIQYLEAQFAARESVRVPFWFGRNELLKHENQAQTGVFWIPKRSSVQAAVDPVPADDDGAADQPKAQKVCRFIVILRAESRDAAWDLHDAFIALCSDTQIHIELGDWEWETEQEHVAAPNLSGSVISQEVSIVALVPAKPGGVARVMTVRRTDHECWQDAEHSEQLHALAE